MEVIQAIRKLLFLEDCVIIPGLGGFVSQYRPAVIDKPTGTFIPPAKEIVFNSELLQNDGLLVSFIEKQEGISTEVARERIDQFVEDCRKQLEQGNPVIIDGVGHFAFDSMRVVRFQADAGTNLFLDSFGLAAFHFREIPRDGNAIINNALVYSEDELSRTIEFSVTELKRPRNHHNLRRIAIAMPLLIAFSLLPYNSRVTDTLITSRASMIPEPSLYRLNYPESQKRDTAKVIEFPLAEAVVSDSATKEIVTSDKVTSDIIKPVVVKPAEVKTEKVTGDKVTGDKVIGKYPVIAGCFKIRENADRLQKQLIDKGYPADIVPTKNGQMFKVRMQTFATKREAIEGLARFRKAEPAMQLWAAL
jgi:nucleoid DNA-binding protein